MGRLLIPAAIEIETILLGMDGLPLFQDGLDGVSAAQNVRGVVFVVDSSALSHTASETGGKGEVEGGLAEAASYLHDVLLTLQRRHTSGKTSKIQGEVPVLIAANKSDLFTSLPAEMVGRCVGER